MVGFAFDRDLLPRRLLGWHRRDGHQRGAPAAAALDARTWRRETFVSMMVSWLGCRGGPGCPESGQRERFNGGVDEVGDGLALDTYTAWLPGTSRTVAPARSAIPRWIGGGTIWSSEATGYQVGLCRQPDSVTVPFEDVDAPWDGCRP